MSQHSFDKLHDDLVRLNDLCVAMWHCLTNNVAASVLREVPAPTSVVVSFAPYIVIRKYEDGFTLEHPQMPLTQPVLYAQVDDVLRAAVDYLRETLPCGDFVWPYGSLGQKTA